MTRLSYNREAFVYAWMEAYRLGKKSTWVDERLGYPKHRSSGIAYALRARGVALPSLQQRAHDVQYLNGIIKSVEREMKGNR